MKDICNSFSEILSQSATVQSAYELSEADCLKYCQGISAVVEHNQYKVLRAFWKNNISEVHLSGSNGYGYNDLGRDTLGKVYADIFNCEAALVRLQIVSGTHAIAVAMLGNLSPGEEIVSATGKPYDTLTKVIGFHNEYGSLAHYGINYRESSLTQQGKIDIDHLLTMLNKKTKMVFFQRSKGYSWRNSISLEELRRAISSVKSFNEKIICFVDNCYGEFVEYSEPTDVGADLIAGSLIKNPGGGLSLTGGYVAGKEELVAKSAVRLSAPGIGTGLGASLNFNHSAYQGLFIAPMIVGEALKGAVWGSRLFELLGYEVLPHYKEPRTDLIQAIRLGSSELMSLFCKGLQKACPLDSQATPEPDFLPGYENKVIMAGGTFIQGSSIELSADGPIRPPYNIFYQGGLSFAHAKIGLLMAALEIENK